MLYSFFFKSLCLLALLPISTLFAQDEYHNFKLAFEFGMNEAGCKLAEHKRLRKDNYPYNKFSLFGTRSYSLVTTYFSLKPEFFVFNNRIGIASGFRYTTATSELVSDNDIYSFLWKVQEEGYNTQYVRLNSLRQKSHLMGIPFEIRSFLNNRELPFQTYIKIGVSFNYCISSESHVNFTNKAMERHKNTVKSQLSKNDNAFSSFAFAAIGFKIGKFKEERNTPWANIEFQFPYILLTNKSFAFVGRGVDIIPGGGFQLSFQIPIGKNVPIGSK